MLYYSIFLITFYIMPMYYSVAGTDSSFILTKGSTSPTDSPSSYFNYSLPLTDNLIQPTIIRPFPGNFFLYLYIYIFYCLYLLK